MNMARRKKYASKGAEHFARLTRRMMETPAWKALSPTAQALYPWLKFEFKGPKFNNNGKINLSVRQAAERLGVTKNTAVKAFHDLQAKGFIVVTEVGHLGVAGHGRSTSYEITEIALPHATAENGRRLYLGWSEGMDFEVKLAPSKL
jgi:DNA-binding transcriptional MocR family regulator